jgi:type I restriction enzyme S subunit
MNIEEIQKLPAEWRWAKLGDVCRVVNGSTPSSDTPEYWDGDICWITPTDLGKQATHLISSSARKITKEGFASCGTETVPVGAVIMSSRAPIGHLGIATVPLCTNQGCKSFVPGEGIDSQFLFHALKKAVPELRALGSGATFAEVSKSQVQAFEILLPPLPEQKRIATILVEQMAAIEKARAAAEGRLKAAKELQAAYLREVFESEDAQGWSITRMDNIAPLIIDGPHITPTYQSSGIPFLTIRNIVTRKINIGNVSYVSEADHLQFSSRGKAEKGDILYSKDGTLGIPCLVDTEDEFSFFVSVALIKLNKEKVDPLYISFALESPQLLEQVKRLGEGAGLKHMVLKSIKSLELKLPPLHEQRRIASMLDKKRQSTLSLVEIINYELATIKSLPAALLRQAFSGEL